MLIHHITLLTGDVAVHRLDILDPAAVAACAGLIPCGGSIPMCSPFRVAVVHGRMFTLYRGSDPVVTCAIGTGPDDTWTGIVALQERVALAPVRAAAPGPQTRWMAVALLPEIVTISRDDLGWIGDFERCMAAALLRAQS